MKGGGKEKSRSKEGNEKSTRKILRRRREFPKARQIKERKYNLPGGQGLQEKRGRDLPNGLTFIFSIHKAERESCKEKTVLERNGSAFSPRKATWDTIKIW